MAEKPRRNARKMSRSEIEQHLATRRPWENEALIRAGIRPERRPWYAQGDAKSGVPAFEAFYHFVDPTRAKTLYALDVSYNDVNDRNPDWPDEELIDYDQKHGHWKQVKETLERDLYWDLRNGKLQARGFSNTAPLDSPRQLIAPERWIDLTLDVKESSAQGPGLVVTQILITRPPTTRVEARTSIRPAAQKLRKWYVDWINNNVARGKIPTREEDYSAARKRFGDTATREPLRILRQELAPEEWKKRGRRPAT